MNTTINGFIDALASKAPTPGGGGASALIGAVGVALCSMVGNLTSGKKKYAAYQSDIERILERAEVSADHLLTLIEKDAEAFEPLAAAYKLPLDAPDRDSILEATLVRAAEVPLEIMREVVAVTEMIEELRTKGSKLAISDVAVAATACRAAIEGAVMNVYINTKLMKDRERADVLNNEAAVLLSKSVTRLEAVYDEISEELRGHA